MKKFNGNETFRYNNKYNYNEEEEGEEDEGGQEQEQEQDQDQYEQVYESEQYEQYEQNEQEEEEEYDDDSSDDEEHVNQQHNQQHNQQQQDNNKTSKIAIKLGNTTLTIGEAKLYGLINKTGEIQYKKQSQNNIKQIKQSVDKLAAVKKIPKLDPTEDKEGLECTFQPKKTEEAIKAMKNQRCGYDFVNRTGEEGNFVERQFSNDKKSKGSKYVLESMKEDYEARLDRLQCPKCRKYQSFDEYIEKRRMCGQCKERFTKLHVSKFKSWEVKQTQNDLKKAEKLAKIEQEVYGNCSFKPKMTSLEEEILLEHRENAKKRKEELKLKEKEEQLKKEEEEKILEEKRKKVQEKLLEQQKIRKMISSENTNQLNINQNEKEKRKEKEKVSIKENNSNKLNTQNKQQRPSSAPPRRPPSSSVNNSNNTNNNNKKNVKYNQTNGNISKKFNLLLSTEINQDN